MRLFLRHFIPYVVIFALLAGLAELADLSLVKIFGQAALPSGLQRACLTFAGFIVICFIICLILAVLAAIPWKMSKGSEMRPGMYVSDYNHGLDVDHLASSN